MEYNDVRGANAFPLRNRLSNPISIARPIPYPFFSLRVLSIIYLLLYFTRKLNKIRWRLFFCFFANGYGPRFLSSDYKITGATTYNIQRSLLLFFFKRSPGWSCYWPISGFRFKVLFLISNSFFLGPHFFFCISGSFFHVTFLSFDVTFHQVITSSMLDVSFYAKDSLNCPTLSSC